MSNLEKYLKKYKVLGEEYTHVSMQGGKYNIPDDKIDELYKILSNTEDYYLVERHLEDKSSLIIDIDIKLENEERYITDRIILKIVKEINIVLDAIFLDANKKVYVLQRDKVYKKDNYYKDGLHIIYPEIIGKYNVLTLIRNILLDELKILEKYSKNTIEDIIDKSVIKTNGLTMYGGDKPDVKDNKYKINVVYDNELKKVKDIEEGYELLKILSIRNKDKELTKLKITDENIDELIGEENNVIEDDEDKGSIDIKEAISNTKDVSILRYILMNILKKERADKYEYWLQIGFSLFNTSKDYLYLWDEFSRRSEKYKVGECKEKWLKMKTVGKKITINTIYYYAIKDNKEMLKDLSIIKSLEKIRDDFPNNSLVVNKIYYDYNNNYMYVDMKDDYCPIYKGKHDNKSNYLEIIKGDIVMKCRDCKCIGKIYPNNKDVNISMYLNNMYNVTINNYNLQEKLDEEVEMEVLEIADDERLNILLTETLNSTNGKAYDIANILHYLFNNEFRYDSEYKNWYYFSGRWRKCNNKLRTKISNNIVEYYNLMKMVLKKKYKKDREIDNKINDQEYKSKLRKIDNLIGDLKTTSFKNNIIKEAEEIFTDNHENILEKLDNNVYLLGFENGVYDIKNKCFRDIKPDDYISMSVKYNYIDENSEEYDKTIEEKLTVFLEEIQPNESQRDYLLTYLSTCIVGINLLQHFVIFLGEGRNGKGKITDLLSSTFGDYYSSFKSKLLTKPSTDANIADPQLLDLRKKRICIGSEPERNDRINSGFTKLLTGRDKMKTRYNHGNDMIEFEVNFKIILLANSVPEADQDDKAYRKRLKCIGFPTTFVDNPTNSNEKKINYNLNVDCFKQYFMLLLIKYFNKYETNGLQQNEFVEELTNKVNIDNNKVLEYMEIKTEKTSNDKDCVHTQTLYEKFKDWFYTNYPNDRVISNKVFLQNLKLNYNVDSHVVINKKDSTGIKGIKFKSFEI